MNTCVFIFLAASLGALVFVVVLEFRLVLCSPVFDSRLFATKMWCVFVRGIRRPG